jgi:L-rhamnose mutarotase
MIKIMTDLPENVVGIELTGEVTKDEYDQVYPEVEKLAKREGEINYLVLLNTEFKNLTLGVWWDDFRLALKHYSKWNKIAVVSNEEGIRNATDIMGFVYPGESRSFALNELEQAKQWVAAQ